MGWKGPAGGAPFQLTSGCDDDLRKVCLSAGRGSPADHPVVPLRDRLGRAGTAPAQRRDLAGSGRVDADQDDHAGAAEPDGHHRALLAADRGHPHLEPPQRRFRADRDDGVGRNGVALRAAAAAAGRAGDDRRRLRQSRRHALEPAALAPVHRAGAHRRADAGDPARPVLEPGERPHLPHSRARHERRALGPHRERLARPCADARPTSPSAASS